MVLQGTIPNRQGQRPVCRKWVAVGASAATGLKVEAVEPVQAAGRGDGDGQKPNPTQTAEIPPFHQAAAPGGVMAAYPSLSHRTCHVALECA